MTQPSGPASTDPVLAGLLAHVTSHRPGADAQLITRAYQAADVQALLRRHLAFAHAHTPAEHAYALDIDALPGPAITFCSYRVGGELLAVGALHQLDETHGEIKSMHTAEAARVRGIGRVMLGTSSRWPATAACAG